MEIKSGDLFRNDGGIVLIIRSNYPHMKDFFGEYAGVKFYPPDFKQRGPENTGYLCKLGTLKLIPENYLGNISDNLGEFTRKVLEGE